MTFLVVILGLTVIVLIMFLCAALSDLKEWKQREQSAKKEVDNLREGNRLLHDSTERIKSTQASIDARLKALEKAAEPERGFKVTLTHYNGDTQVFEHVHEMGRRGDFIELNGKDGKLIALVDDSFHTLIKEDYE